MEKEARDSQKILILGIQCQMILNLKHSTAIGNQASLILLMNFLGMYQIFSNESENQQIIVLQVTCN